MIDIRTHNFFKTTISVPKTTTAIEPSSTPAPACTPGVTVIAVVPPPAGLTCQSNGRVLNREAEFTTLGPYSEPAVSLEKCAARCLIYNADRDPSRFGPCSATQFDAATGGCSLLADSVAENELRVDGGPYDALIDDPTNSAILSDAACFVFKSC